MGNTATRNETRNETMTTAIKSMTTADLHQAAHKYDRINNEGGDGYNPYDQEIDDRLVAELQAIKAANLLEWTLDTTLERKAEWNDRIRSGEFVRPDGNGDRDAVRRCEESQGWTSADLRRAVARHDRG
jgi:hypothetical protein